MRTHLNKIFLIITFWIAPSLYIPRSKPGSDVLDRRRLALRRQLHDDVTESLGERSELRLHYRCHDAIVNVTWKRRSEKEINHSLRYATVPENDRSLS